MELLKRIRRPVPEVSEFSTNEPATVDLATRDFVAAMAGVQWGETHEMQQLDM